MCSRCQEKSTLGQAKVEKQIPRSARNDKGSRFLAPLGMTNDGGLQNQVMQLMPRIRSGAGSPPRPPPTLLRDRELQRFEMRGEVAQERSFVGQAHSGDAIALLPDFENHFHHVIDVALGVDAAGDRETD